MKTQNLRFGEAVKFLASLAGMKAYLFSKKDEQREKDWTTYKEIYQNYIEYFHNELLKNKNSNDAKAYIKNRGLKLDQVKDFKLVMLRMKLIFMICY